MLNAEILSPSKGLASVWWSYDVALSALVQKFGRGNFTFERIKATGRRFPILAALRNDAVLVVAGKLNCPCYVYEGWFYTHLDPKAVDEDKDGHGEKKRRDDAMKRTGDDLHCVPIIGGELYDLDLPVDEVESNNTVTPPLQRHLCAKEILQINEDGSFRRGKPHRGNECGDIIEGYFREISRVYRVVLPPPEVPLSEVPSPPDSSSSSSKKRRRRALAPLPSQGQKKTKLF